MSQINEQIREYTWQCLCATQYTQPISDGRALHGTMFVAINTHSSLAAVFLGCANCHVKKKKLTNSISKVPTYLA